MIVFQRLFFKTRSFIDVDTSNRVRISLKQSRATQRHVGPVAVEQTSYKHDLPYLLYRQKRDKMLTFLKKLTALGSPRTGRPPTV